MVERNSLGNKRLPSKAPELVGLKSSRKKLFNYHKNRKASQDKDNNKTILKLQKGE